MALGMGKQGEQTCVWQYSNMSTSNQTSKIVKEVVKTGKSLPGSNRNPSLLCFRLHILNYCTLAFLMSVFLNNPVTKIINKYDTCAWTPNNVLNTLMVLGLVASKVPDSLIGNSLDTLA